MQFGGTSNIAQSGSPGGWGATSGSSSRSSGSTTRTSEGTVTYQGREIPKSDAIRLGIIDAPGESAAKYASIGGGTSTSKIEERYAIEDVIKQQINDGLLTKDEIKGAKKLLESKTAQWAGKTQEQKDILKSNLYWQTKYREPSTRFETEYIPNYQQELIKTIAKQNILKSSGLDRKSLIPKMNVPEPEQKYFYVDQGRTRTKYAYNMYSIDEMTGRIRESNVKKFKNIFGGSFGIAEDEIKPGMVYTRDIFGGTRKGVPIESVPKATKERYIGEAAHRQLMYEVGLLLTPPGVFTSTTAALKGSSFIGGAKAIFKEKVPQIVKKGTPATRLLEIKDIYPEIINKNQLNAAQQVFDQVLLKGETQAQLAGKVEPKVYNFFIDPKKPNSLFVRVPKGFEKPQTSIFYPIKETRIKKLSRQIKSKIPYEFVKRGSLEPVEVKIYSKVVQERAKLNAINWDKEIFKTTKKRGSGTWNVKEWGGIIDKKASQEAIKGVPQRPQIEGRELYTIPKPKSQPKTPTEFKSMFAEKEAQIAEEIRTLFSAQQTKITLSRTAIKTQVAAKPQRVQTFAKPIVSPKLSMPASQVLSKKMKVAEREVNSQLQDLKRLFEQKTPFELKQEVYSYKKPEPKQQRSLSPGIRVFNMFKNAGIAGVQPEKIDLPKGFIIPKERMNLSPKPYIRTQSQPDTKTQYKYQQKYKQVLKTSQKSIPRTPEKTTRRKPPKPPVLRYPSFEAQLDDYVKKRKGKYVWDIKNPVPTLKSLTG